MPDQDSARVQATEAKPVVWTPEDANRFLTAAIHEANRPLEEQLKRRPLPGNWILAIVAFVILAGCVVALLLSSQLEKTEARAEAINRQREELLTQKVQLEAQSMLLEERLTAASAQVSTLAAGNEELRGAKNEVARYRRQNELLHSQISGLEMEKEALARQLAAVKAMAIEDSLLDPGPEPAKVQTPEPAKEQEPAQEPEAVKVPEEKAEPAPVPEPVEEVKPAEEMNSVAEVKPEEKPEEAIVPPVPEPDPAPAVTPDPAEPPVAVEEPVVEESPAAEEPATVEDPVVIEEPPAEESPVPEPVGEPVTEPVETQPI